MREHRTDFMRDLATFRRGRGFRWRAENLPIRFMLVDDIHRGIGSSIRRVRGGIEGFKGLGICF